MIDRALDYLATNAAFMTAFFHVALFCAEFVAFLAFLAAAAIVTTWLFAPSKSAHPQKRRSCETGQRASCPGLLPLELGLCAPSTRITVHGDALPVEEESELEGARR